MSDVTLGVKECSACLGLSFSVCLSQGLYFSVLFSESSFSVCFPCFVLNLSTSSTTPTGRSHVKKPCLKLHLEFRDLAIILK